ncbi:serine hydrolase [Lewinella sp. W8]|uniref:serine hydrolase domain-containing protein n=1 Tax=Lewinella sp. W8 TaxID=2528208 RepID=UPI00106784F0|nr:serine hydrolase [Lewinella sp. W8]MTB52190.1 serine hydrolase [Lewinella sp. W8]
MKTKVTSVIVLVLFLFSSPLAAEGWADTLWDWFSGLFGREDAVYTEEYTDRQMDSLRLTPQGANLLEIPLSDTLLIGANWPRATVDVAGTLERHNRMLSQTVLLRNPADQLPYFGVPAVRVVYRYDQRPVHFLRMARRFADVQEVAFDESVLPLFAIAAELPTIIMVDDPPNQSPFNADWYRVLKSRTGSETSLVHFGDPALLKELRSSWAVLNTPMRTPETEHLTAQALFGAQTIDGRLETGTALFSAGEGERLDAVRDGFRMPEEVGIDRMNLERVDYQVNRAIRYRATPGAQLAIFKDGHLVYERAYGHHRYRSQAVDPGDLYDLASVTKAAATTLAVMKLYDQQRIELDAKVKDYLPEFAESIVGRYKIEHLLAHHTGLQSDLPLYDYLGRQYVSTTENGDFLLPIAADRWLDRTVPNLIRGQLGRRLQYTRRLKYQYSDINYVLLQYVVEGITGETLDDFVSREFYEPLGLQRLTFRPHEKYPDVQTVPTARDTWMRGGVVRGYVHDEGAALMGGVAGHAGLFANAHDLGRLFQLLVDEGEFAGQQLLSPETIARFTRKNTYNYRALGFDRLVGGWRSVVRSGASPNTFGHLGFSGTAVWADPDNDLVFVLLTNRIHPDPKNERFNKMNVRGRTHRAVYGALGSWGMTL